MKYNNNYGYVLKKLSDEEINVPLQKEFEQINMQC